MLVTLSIAYLMFSLSTINAKGDDTESVSHTKRKRAPQFVYTVPPPAQTPHIANLPNTTWEPPSTPASPPGPQWIRVLSSTEMASIKSGWKGYGKACSRELDTQVRNYFFYNANTTQTVEAILSRKVRKDGVCDFISQYLWCGALLNSCICRKGAVFLDGECKILEGAFDCGRNYYDAAFTDDNRRDNRANLLEPLNCVPNAACVQDDRLRSPGDNTSRIFICKPNTPGSYPEAKKYIMELTKRSMETFKWLPRGSSCKIHLNTDSEITQHWKVKEEIVRKYSSSIREVMSRCDAYRNEECHKIARICVCAKGFVLQDNECRLSGSVALFDDKVRKCEWEVWPSFIVSNKLLELEKYTPDAVPVNCVTNATCKPNAACDSSAAHNPECFKTCQCEPGKICAIPKPIKFNLNSVQNIIPSSFTIIIFTLRIL